MAKDNRSLGQFKLEGIPPAPRGVPQIEGTFDIDANGILNVSAKDKGTGKEQSITISGSTNLDQSEIDRMVKEAEQYGEEDKKRRQEVEERNQADILAHQVERQMKEFGDSLPANEKARTEQLLNDLKEALKENAPIDKIRSLQSDLQQAAHSLSEAAYKKTAGPGGTQQTGSSGSGSGQADSGGDDVTPVEYQPSASRRGLFTDSLRTSAYGTSFRRTGGVLYSNPITHNARAASPNLEQMKNAGTMPAAARNNHRP